ncbi:MAG: hypothetical protein JWN48_5054 [Myxococcaceae bacterium]|nr:hypothetical protein [Myxococcaceae bacterium]
MKTRTRSARLILSSLIGLFARGCGDDASRAGKTLDGTALDSPTRAASVSEASVSAVDADAAGRSLVVPWRSALR